MQVGPVSIPKSVLERLLNRPDIQKELKLLPANYTITSMEVTKEGFDQRENTSWGGDLVLRMTAKAAE